MSRGRQCLIDSNILIYMHDDKRPDFQQRAVQVYTRLVETDRVALSTQCLTEFFSAVTRKLRVPLTSIEASVLLDQIANAAAVYPITLDIVRDATAATVKYQMSMWDALIWSVAFRHAVPTIVTEDVQSQPVIAGVRYVNPIAPDVDIESL
jgi:predicted nucleic acid-binding protein